MVFVCFIQAYTGKCKIPIVFSENVENRVTFLSIVIKINQSAKGMIDSFD